MPAERFEPPEPVAAAGSRLLDLADRSTLTGELSHALGWDCPIFTGVFADPDGHAWEIAYNPGFPLAEDGSITIPDFNAS